MKVSREWRAARFDTGIPSLGMGAVVKRVEFHTMKTLRN